MIEIPDRIEFRQHRGGFEESMKTAVLIEPTLSALVCEIRREWEEPNIARLDIRWYAYDPRIHQHMWAVLGRGGSMYGWLSHPLRDHPYLGEHDMERNYGTG